jgi:quinol monooxygenase YgiN
VGAWKQTLICVLRRWFVPSGELEQFTERWRNDILPAIRRQSGCIRVDLFESSIREHWVLSGTWEDAEARAKALSQLAPLAQEFAQYERFEPEILTLRSSTAVNIG